jgi:mono/diheme cytochrome c family protein
MKTAAAGVGMLSMLLAAGCRQDMQDQPRMIPQRATTFFDDGRSVRPQVQGTVARGQLHGDAFFYTGMLNGKEADMLPFPATLTVLERGQERFNVYCTPCHSRVGNGAGMIVQRGYKAAANFHSPDVIAKPLGFYFRVMTEGYGAMPDYAQQLTPEDRWAVAAYIRALQLSQNAKQSDIPAGTAIEPLSQIAKDQGYPESFAGVWPLPSTAVNPVPGPQTPVAGVIGTAQPGLSPQVEAAKQSSPGASHPNRLKVSGQTEPDRPDETQPQWAPLKP